MTWASGQGPAPASPPVDQQRQQLQQQLQQLQQQIQQLGTEPPTPEIQRQVQQVSQLLAQLRTEATRQALKDAYGNPFLIKRGDPIPK
jgi:chromosome segregation ATPase